MKVLAAVLFVSLGLLLAARADAARLPRGADMVQRLHAFHETHTVRTQVRHGRQSVDRIGRFHETHTLRQPSR